MGSVKGGEYVGTVGGRVIGGWLVGRGGEVCTGFFHLSEVGRRKNSNFFRKNFFSATSPNQSNYGTVPMGQK